MKKILSVFILLLSLSISGCNSNESNVNVTEGYIVKKKDKNILVVNDAIWFSNAPADVQVGQKVQVWYDFVAESYPGQSSAKKVVILESNKPDNANLTEADAIRKALDQVAEHVIPLIKSINYNEKADEWNIQINETTIQVDDK